MIALNALWVVDTAVAVAAGWLSPTTIGTVWAVLQGVTVAGLAVLQLLGL